MVLIEILLPLRDNAGNPQPSESVSSIRHELTDRFGGLTAFTRSPAEGVWVDDGSGIQHDEIVVLEVMADSLDRAWWSKFRARLERQFHQKEIVIRAQTIEKV